MMIAAIALHELSTLRPKCDWGEVGLFGLHLPNGQWWAQPQSGGLDQVIHQNQTNQQRFAEMTFKLYSGDY